LDSSVKTGVFFCQKTLEKRIYKCYNKIVIKMTIEREMIMVTKISKSMIKLHTHTQVIFKNTEKDEITRGYYAIKYIH